MFKAVFFVLAGFLALAAGAPADVSADVPADPFANLSKRTRTILNNTQEIVSAIIDIHDTYSSFAEIITVDPELVKQLIMRIKAQKHEIHASKVDINSYLTTFVSYQIQERSVLEFDRIALERYEKALDKMAMNLLGARAGITKIMKERVSEELSTAVALESAKLTKLATEIAEVDAELQKVRSDASDGSGKKAQVVALEELTSIISRTRQIRVEMSQAWLADLEAGVVNGLETNMLQSVMMDTLLASLVWFENYCRNYEELMQKILGTQHQHHF